MGDVVPAALTSGLGFAAAREGTGITRHPQRDFGDAPVFYCNSITPLTSGPELPQVVTLAGRHQVKR